MNQKNTVVTLILLVSSIITYGQAKKPIAKAVNPNALVINDAKKELKFAESISGITNYQHYIDTICNGNTTHKPHYFLVNNKADYDLKTTSKEENIYVGYISSVEMIETFNAYYIIFQAEEPNSDNISNIKYVFDADKKLMTYAFFSPGYEYKIIFDKNHKVIFNESIEGFDIPLTKSKVKDETITKAKTFNEVLSEIKFNLN